MKSESAIIPKKHKPHPRPHEERFEHLFELAFQGFCAGAKFAVPDPDSHGVRHLDSRQELGLLRHIAFLSWNAAGFACELFKDRDEEIAAFNANVKVSKEEAQ